MATILLQAAGAYLGGFLGSVGGAIGTAAGAIAGYMVDSALVNSTRRVEGPRLTGARPFTAEEGAAIPRLYGTARLGGTLIWATRFKETSATHRQGKLGPKVTEYSYFANVAFLLCEGEIAGVRRIWADGNEIDREDVELRVYRGSGNQPADPLIEAKQGAGNTPAYRGVAYVVLERFDIGPYGNRIPQLQFEVIRPIGKLNRRIEAISLLPGAIEYGLSAELVTRRKRPGERVALNRQVLFAGTDIAASLDELQMTCPNLRHVALVVSWFGDDLRAGHCRIRPAVTTADGTELSSAWLVSGIARNGAPVVSRHGDGAAFGGTPSDRSVLSAIGEIKARGLSVTLYPFLMMDIPDGNELPDPGGAASQPAYPWRGRITSDPAPTAPGTADRTASVRSQVEAFCGAAQPTQFSASADGIAFSGSPGDWGYRRLVLHYAHLAKKAGGVDAFLVGSELRGLTTLRDQDNAFPFVEALCALAADVRSVLGTQTRITYGADWSEYFGYHPQDGSGDVYYHLDALWAHPAIGAVGIDNYMPLSDWRDVDYGGVNPDGFAGPYDPRSLKAWIAGGEGFDWYYASDEDRRQRRRSPITDGAYGKPWVYRYKDLVNWWSRPHYDRAGGVEAGTPTAWVAEGKPIWFTELGCPAADKGPNQPNAFPDAKSAENASPYFSDGGRSDAAQRCFLEAHMDYWDDAQAGFEEGRNPLALVGRVEQKLERLAFEPQCGFERRILAGEHRFLDLRDGERRQPRDLFRRLQRQRQRLAFRRKHAYQPGALGFLGWKKVAGQHQHQRLVLADGAQQPLRAASARHQAELDLRLAELRGSRGHDDVGMHGKLAAAAERIALHRGDDGLRAAGYHVPVTMRLLREHVGRAELFERLDVGAGGEIPAPAADDDRADLWVFGKAGDRRRELFADFEIDGVARLGAIDLDQPHMRGRPACYHDLSLSVHAGSVLVGYRSGHVISCLKDYRRRTMRPQQAISVLRARRRSA